MATTPTAAQHLQRFNAWMDVEYPDFEYTKAQAEKLLRDYRMGRVTLPVELEQHLAHVSFPGKTSKKSVFPGKQAPTKKAPRKKAAPKPRTPADRRRAAPPPPPPPPVRIQASQYHPPARPSAHADADEDDDYYSGDDFVDIDEEDEDDYVYADAEIEPMGYVPFLDDWADYGDTDIDYEGTES